MTLREFTCIQQRELLVDATQKASNYGEAASLLGISIPTFYRLLAKLGVGRRGNRTQSRNRTVRFALQPVSPMALVRRPLLPDRAPASVAMLRAFGYKGKLSAPNFWRQPKIRLSWYYYDFQKRYRELARAAHPDAGGNAKEFQKVTEVWTALKRRFQRLCPDL